MVFFFAGKNEESRCVEEPEERENKTKKTTDFRDKSPFKFGWVHNLTTCLIDYSSSDNGRIKKMKSWVVFFFFFIFFAPFVA